jgi:EmrB/QacA subfamily drug resistance transporter
VATHRRANLGWAIVVTGVAEFMVTLDALVVTMALPVIRHRLHTGLAGLEWVVNAFTLSFAVLLLSGAALGDRYGRRRLFLFGLLLFVSASAAAALAPNIDLLIAARAVQGAGGALVVPLTLTLLSEVVPPDRRNWALGIWGAIGGAAIAIGPLVGGAVVQALSWPYIFWLNVPIGLFLIPLSWLRLRESYGPSRHLDLRGVLAASAGFFGIVYGLVRGPQVGWTSRDALVGLAGGCVFLVVFIGLEHSGSEPMLPLVLFRNRQFAVTNVVSLSMTFGMFGSIFLFAQYLQTVQHYSPLSAGVRTLPWTVMPVLAAPLAGLLVDKVGGRTIVALGMALQGAGLAWIAVVLSPTTPYLHFVPAFVCTGVGMALFFVPIASLALGSVAAESHGVASGVNNALRELGGVLGVSALGAIFAAAGGYRSVGTFEHGLFRALVVGAAVVGGGAALALANPRAVRRPRPRRPSS